MHRRRFLEATGAAAAGLAVGGLTRSVAAAPRGDDLRVAVIGLRGQGQNHLRALGQRVVAVCDVDATILAERADRHEAEHGRPLERHQDYRELLDRAEIDAVSIATPNHTHVLIAIAAIEAGKDVYVEKPVSHNVWEGRQLVAAAREHGRVVQCGTQSRSSPALREAVAWVRGGALGEVSHAVGTCYKPRKAIGRLSEPLQTPSSLDYDLWCGPAEKRELYRPNLHYDWHWSWNTGNGDMGNQGIHQMDIARWFLGEEGLAPRTISVGGRLGYDDAGDTPNTQLVYHDYERAPLLFETRGLPRAKADQGAWGESMDHYRGSRVGVVVQCDGGHLLVPSYSEAIAYDRRGKEIRRWAAGGNHHANWLEAVAAGDPGLLNAEIREGHVSSALCHVGNVSHQVGEPTVAREIGERLAAYPLLSAAFDRMASHLRANEARVDEPDEALTLGPWLEVDVSSETPVGNDAAAELFARTGREPFTVPDYNA